MTNTSAGKDIGFFVKSFF